MIYSSFISGPIVLASLACLSLLGYAMFWSKQRSQHRGWTPEFLGGAGLDHASGHNRRTARHSITHKIRLELEPSHYDLSKYRTLQESDEVADQVVERPKVHGPHQLGKPKSEDGSSV